MRTPLTLAAASLLALGTTASAEPVIIVTPEATLTVEATVESGELWIPADDLVKVNGFELKPEGVCLGEELCVSLPAEQDRWVRRSKAGTQFNLSGFASHMKQAVASNAEGTVWSFGEVPTGGGLKSGKAPDFALQDMNGKTVRLSQFRGKKVLLWVWASW